MRKIEKDIAYFVTLNTLDDFLKDLGPFRPTSSIDDIREYLEDIEVNHIVFYIKGKDLLYDTRFEEKQYEQVTLEMLNSAGFNLIAKQYYIPNRTVGVQVEVRASGVKIKVNQNIIYKKQRVQR